MQKFPGGNVSGENVSGENVSGENVSGENVSLYPNYILSSQVAQWDNTARISSLHSPEFQPDVDDDDVT